MDPEANLKEQLEIAKDITEGEQPYSAMTAFRLAELVIALDEWLNKGGFKPARWER